MYCKIEACFSATKHSELTAAVHRSQLHGRTARINAALY